jgi:hypothetical protein
MHLRVVNVTPVAAIGPAARQGHRWSTRWLRIDAIPEAGREAANEVSANGGTTFAIDTTLSAQNNYSLHRHGPVASAQGVPSERGPLPNFGNLQLARDQRRCRNRRGRRISPRRARIQLDFAEHRERRSGRHQQLGPGDGSYELGDPAGARRIIYDTGSGFLPPIKAPMRR